MLCAMPVNSTSGARTPVLRQPLILASASPRRRDLLTEMGVAFEVRPSPLHEPQAKPVGVSARVWAEAVAVFKARSVANLNPERWVLGADTIVVCCGSVLGKPADLAAARQMLEMQAGQPAEVITGLCLARVETDERVRRIVRHDVTWVWMRDDAAQREAYLAGGDWRGKAGAYGIQDVADRLVERVQGSVANVVGLPVERLREMLELADSATNG
jgi:septum formation protein